MPPDVLVHYEKLVATHPKAERKGATMPYTSRNGHMFSFLTKEGRLALRLPETARDEFVRKYKARPVVQHGAVMKEYVEVPGRLMARTSELSRYFSLGYDYVGSLPPKSTKKK